MVQDQLKKPWFEKRPELVEDVRRSLAGYPHLHLFICADGAEVSGTFPVRDENGRELDRYQVRIELPSDYPRGLPTVRETGGRIPWDADRHVYPLSGIACVLLPETRSDSFPVGTSFATYLDVPLRNYFLGQSIVELGGKWPFGEWGHDENGIIQFYIELLNTTDGKTIGGFINALRQASYKGHRPCPCASGKRLRDCCREKFVRIRERVSCESAEHSARMIQMFLKNKPPEGEMPNPGGEEDQRSS